MIRRMRPRVIPCLLMDSNSLVKPIRFKNPQYVGDPLNAIKIFNGKEVDELILIDIKASVLNKEPDYDLIGLVAESCFMPLCYGGGIKNIDQAERIFHIGVEKIALNKSAYRTPGLISEIAKIYGIQSVVVSVDVKKNIFGKYSVCIDGGQRIIKGDVVSYVKTMEEKGAGEILLTAVDKEGTWNGYDYELIKKVAEAVHIPVIASGGAGCIDHLKSAFEAGASAMALGSMVVFQKKGMGVLINFPKIKDLDLLFNG